MIDCSCAAGVNQISKIPPLTPRRLSSSIINEFCMWKHERFPRRWALSSGDRCFSAPDGLPFVSRLKFVRVRVGNGTRLNKDSRLQGKRKLIQQQMRRPDSSITAFLETPRLSRPGLHLWMQTLGRGPRSRAGGGKLSNGATLTPTPASHDFLRLTVSQKSESWNRWNMNGSLVYEEKVPGQKGAATRELQEATRARDFSSLSSSGFIVKKKKKNNFRFRSFTDLDSDARRTSHDHITFTTTVHKYIREGISPHQLIVLYHLYHKLFSLVGTTFQHSPTNHQHRAARES